MTSTTTSTKPRLLGVDLARAMAFLAMVLLHLTPPAALSPLTVLAGRSAALFVLLTGVSAVLSLRAAAPTREDRARLALRGLLVLVLGVVLGALPSGIAVILTTTGVLLVLASFLVGLRTSVLAGAAALVLVLAPVLSHLLRMHLEPFGGRVPSPWTLDPGLVTEVLVTGYYPVLTWSGYLLAGLAAGSFLVKPRPKNAPTSAPRALSGAGGVSLALAVVAHRALERPVSFYAEHLEGSLVQARDFSAHLSTGFYGTTPTSSWWWLAVDAPHSGTPVDLLSTTGTALLVLAAALAVPAQATRIIRPLVVLGAMPLSAYTLHVVMTSATGPGVVALLVQVLLLVGLSSAWALLARRGHLPRRGPLEHTFHKAISAALPTRT